MNRITFAVLITLLVILVSPVLADEPETEKPAPTLTGTWVKNVLLSDDPAKVMPKRERPQGGMGGGSMGRGGMSGGGTGRGGAAGGGGRGGKSGGMGRGGKVPDGIDDAPPGRKPRNMMAGLDRLEIFREGEEFAVTDDMDIMQSLFTDGRSTERWTAMGQIFETATVTSDGIVVRSEATDGPGRVVTYTLKEDGNQMTVIHSFKPPKSDKTITLRMVYDRSE